MDPNSVYSPPGQECGARNSVVTECGCACLYQEILIGAMANTPSSHSLLIMSNTCPLQTMTEIDCLIKKETIIIYVYLCPVTHQ